MESLPKIFPTSFAMQSVSSIVPVNRKISFLRSKSKNELHFRRAPLPPSLHHYLSLLHSLLLFFLLGLSLLWYTKGTRSQTQSGCKLPPMSFGDDFHGSIDDFDGCLFVDGISRDANVSRPALCVSHGVRRESVQVGED